MPKKKGPNKVCRLKKFYELKQSPRIWFSRSARVMIDLGYKEAQGDHTPFIKHSEIMEVVLLIYVDDIIVTRDYKKKN